MDFGALKDIFKYLDHKMLISECDETFLNSELFEPEGVVVIPAEIANEVAAEAHAQTRYEDFVLEKVNEGRSIFGIYPAREEARAEFEQWLEARRADP